MILVILSAAKDLVLVAKASCGAGGRSFAALRTTDTGDAK